MKRIASLAVACVGLLYACLATGYSALGTRLHRDEHQFMASAALVARAGLQPYRDFAYFHMPNLIYGYQPLFLSSRPFLAARLTSAACAFSLCLVVFFATRARFQRDGNVTAAATAAAAIILFCNTDLFQGTAGKIWNQSSALLCALAALFTLFRGVRETRVRWFVFSGLSLGMAIGIRLTFAPLIAPFLFAAGLCGAAAWPARRRQLLGFMAGAFVSNLPTLYFCLTNMDNFLFGQFGYHGLNRLYLQETSPGKDVSYTAKLQALIESLRGDLATGGLVIVVFVALGLFLFEMWRKRAKVHFEAGFLASALPFLLLGSMAPSPAYRQYWFQLLPFLLLLGLIVLSRLPRRLSLPGRLALFSAAALSFFHGADIKKHVGHVSRVWQPRSWTPMRVFERAAHIRTILPADTPPVVTLSPIYPIEAGLPIVPEFATGPFAWRVSHFVSREEAAARKMPWSPDIAGFLRARAPLAGVTGKDMPTREGPLVEALLAQGYSPTTAGDGVVVWRAPAAGEASSTPAERKTPRRKSALNPRAWRLCPPRAFGLQEKQATRRSASHADRYPDVIPGNLSRASQ